MRPLRLISVFKSSHGGWAARSVDLPGFDARGRTLLDALRELIDAHEQGQLEEALSLKAFSQRQTRRRKGRPR